MLVAAGLLVGCHSTSAPPPVSNAATSPLPAPPPVLELGELTLTFDGQPIAYVHVDGRTELVCRDRGCSTPLGPGHTFHADGTIVSPWGEQYLRVDADGDIYMISGDDAVVAHVTSETLTFTYGEAETIRLVQDVLLLPWEANRYRVIGATRPGLRRTMLVVTAVNFLMGAWPPTHR